MNVMICENTGIGVDEELHMGTGIRIAGAGREGGPDLGVHSEKFRFATTAKHSFR